MREILFRGKSTYTEIWYEGWYVPPVDYNGKHWDASISYKVESGHLEDVEVIPETVGQFTGLTDKNGKKIFEGDILKGYWSTVLVIFYDEISTSYRVKTSTGYEREPSYYGVDKFEVIGNIHDNPELIKQEA